MKQFVLPLMEGIQRPTIYLKDFFKLQAMLDTGALFPVWVGDETDLQALGAVPVVFNQPFGGFGGLTTGTIYKIPLLRCGGLLFPDFPIIAASCDLPCHMICSATMFSHLIYEIDDFHHQLNVTIPDSESPVRKLAIENRDGRLHVLCTGSE